MDEKQLDQFNQSLRADPEYRQLLQSMGVNPDAPVKLNGNQRKQIEQWVRAKKGDIGKLTIDEAGNVNQKEGFMKELKKWGPIAGGAALTAFGIPGTAFTGLFGGGAGAAASGAGSTLANTSGSWAPAAMGISGSTGTAAATGGILSGIGASLKNPQNLLDLGRGVASLGESAAHNRGQELGADENAAGIDRQNMSAWNTAMINREAEGRAGANDAMRNVQRTEYINNATGYTPANRGDGRGVLPSYGFGPQASTQTEKDAASQLQMVAKRRLEEGNPIPELTPPGPFTSDARNPGMTERISNIAGPALSIWSILNRGRR